MAEEKIIEAVPAEKPDKNAESGVEENKDPVAIPGTTVLESVLKAWKKQYKKVFVTDYMGERYVWRRLTDPEFAKIAQDTEEIKDEDELVAVREKEFCKLCVLYPDKEKTENNIKDDLVSSRVAREILFHSGFFPPRTVEL